MLREKKKFENEKFSMHTLTLRPASAWPSSSSQAEMCTTFVLTIIPFSIVQPNNNDNLDDRIEKKRGKKMEEDEDAWVGNLHRSVPSHRKFECQKSRKGYTVAMVGLLNCTLFVVAVVAFYRVSHPTQSLSLSLFTHITTPQRHHTDSMNSTFLNRPQSQTVRTVHLFAVETIRRSTLWTKRKRLQFNREKGVCVRG